MKGIFYKIAVLLILLSPIKNLCAQVEVTKTIMESYDFSNSGEFQLENKYGNIILNGWNKNTLEIKIHIEVNKKEKDDAQELLDRIRPSITATEDFVKTVTVIEEKRNNIFTRLWNQTNPFDFDKGNIKIDYEIYLPTTAEIEVSNKFGDIIISDWEGKLKATSHHGDIWIKDKLINASIDLRYGKLQTKSIDYASIQLKNGEMELETSKDLLINSSGSTISINQATDIEINSNKDKTIINTIERIQGTLKFADLRIEMIEESLDLTLEVTDLLVNKVQKPDPIILIRQKSSDIQMSISNLNFEFTAHLEQGLLRIPSSFNNIKTDVLDKKKNARDITASFGSGNLGKFKLIGEKGTIILKDN